MMRNLKRNWLAVWKLTWGIWQILTRALQSIKNLHFNGLLLSKLHIVWAKKVQRNYLSWHWRMMQDLKKKMKIFGKFSPEHTKVSKLGFTWDYYFQSRKCMNLKFTEGLWVMTMKNDAKFGKDLTCCFKTGIRNFTNFDLKTWKSQKFAV